MNPSLAKINSNDVSWSPKRLKLKGFKPFLLSVTMTFHILRSIYMGKTHAKPLKIRGALAFYESPLLDTSMSHLWQN